MPIDPISWMVGERDGGRTEAGTARTVKRARPNGAAKMPL